MQDKSNTQYLFYPLQSVQCGLGESPYWHPLEKKLYWIDIKEYKIYRYDPLNQQIQTWKLPGIIGGLAGMQSGGLIIGFEDKIACFDLKTNALKILFDSKSGLRMNDAYVDSMGRFWIGQAADNLHPIAQLYCYEPNGHCKIVESNLNISNGLDWDLQRNRFYLIDSIQKTIYVYDYNAQNGTICNRRCFIDTSATQGYPDGMILDSQGYLWVCFWEGSKIIRYSPDATVDISIDTPISRPTKCIFGGSFLQTLYLTSAASNVNNEEMLLQPAGFTYSISVGVSGHLATLFAG